MSQRVLPASCRQQKLGPAGKMPAARWSRSTMSRRAVIAVMATLTFAGCGVAQARSKEFSFATRILPVITKAGCNIGACHGAATGQGGFKLSLLGYDPDQDHAGVGRAAD